MFLGAVPFQILSRMTLTHTPPNTVWYVSARVPASWALVCASIGDGVRGGLAEPISVCFFFSATSTPSGHAQLTGHEIVFFTLLGLARGNIPSPEMCLLVPSRKNPRGLCPEVLPLPVWVV